MSHQEDTTKERKATPHINRCERDTIERFYKEGLSIGQIALLLKRDKSTIKREIKRGTVTQVKQNPAIARKWTGQSVFHTPSIWPKWDKRGTKKIVRGAEQKTKSSNALIWWNSWSQRFVRERNGLWTRLSVMRKRIGCSGIRLRQRHFITGSKIG